MIKVGWRLGEVSRRVTNRRSPVVGQEKWVEDWYGIAAQTGLTDEQFELSIVKIENEISDHVETKSHKLELHVKFSFEVHLYDF